MLGQTKNFLFTLTSCVNKQVTKLLNDKSAVMFIQGKMSGTFDVTISTSFEELHHYLKGEEHL